MKNSTLATIVLAASAAGTLPSTAAAQTAPTAAALIAAADKVRNPPQAFGMSLTIVEYRSGKAHDAVVMANVAKTNPDTGQYRNLVRWAEPAKDVGKAALLNANNMWFFDPASKASVRISAQQRLIGQAAVGDILTVNLGHDYTPKLVGDESIQDADKEARSTWHVDLTASTNEAMYARLEVWIEKDTNRTIKTKFYSASGRLLKLAYYRRYEPALGASPPRETIIVDAIDAHLVTKITISDQRAVQAQDTWFSREYLPRVKDE